MDEKVYKIKEGYIVRNILDEYIIVPIGEAASDDTYVMSVNESGHFLWSLLESGATVELLLEKMLEEYEVDEETAQNDINKFVTLLNEKNILE